MTQEQQKQKKMQDAQLQDWKNKMKTRKENLEYKEFALKETQVEVAMMEATMEYHEISPKFEAFSIKLQEENRLKMEEQRAQITINEPNSAEESQVNELENAHTEG